MNISDFRSHCLNTKELYFGAAYLVFDAVFLAPILQALNLLLPTPLPQSMVNFLFFSVNFGAVVLILRRYLCEQLKLLPDVIGKMLGVAAVGLFAYWAMNFVLVQLLLEIDPGFFSVNDVNIQSLVAEDYALMFIGTVILVPVAEESLFRGLLFRGFYDRSPVCAWLLSVLLFAGVHVMNYLGAYPASTIFLCFLQYIPAGICLAGAYRVSGSIFCPILIHATVNFLGVMALR